VCLKRYTASPDGNHFRGLDRRDHPDEGDPVRLTRVRRSAVLVVLAAGLLTAQAPAASAHPLGNATVNHFDGLRLYPDRLVDHAVEDVAEIPTYQRKSRIDTDGDGAVSSDERAAYAGSQCRAMAASVTATVRGDRVRLTVEGSSYAEKPGQVSLTTGRLECELRGDVELSSPTELRFENLWDDDGIGWHEITAVGVGVSLKGSPFPEQGISDELRRYPGDLLSSPLDVRSGTVSVVPGGGSSTYRATKDLPVAGPAVRALNHLATTFNEVVGRKHLTVGVGLLGILLSLLLGAGHAFLPGHGKTIMAAYLVGRRGRLRDVVTVGATVTITHTAGVLVLGLLIASTSAFAPTAAEQLLGVVSGVIVAAVGVGLLVSAIRNRHRSRLVGALAPEPALVGAAVPAGHHDHHDHHDHDQHGHGDDPHDHSHDHSHDHEHDHGHKHGLFGGHKHSHDPADSFSRTGLVGLGIAGGLVPSPSALLVLLAATALGRTVFGVVLVLGYGLGMALALCAAGLVLVKLRGKLDRFAGSRKLARADKLLAYLPVLTALLVLAVGTGLALRAAGGSV
jgi:nickel/cobalt exporter